MEAVFGRCGIFLSSSDDDSADDNGVGDANDDDCKLAVACNPLLTVHGCCR